MLQPVFFHLCSFCFLHLMTYHRILIPVCIVGTLKFAAAQKTVHLVLIQIDGTGIVLFVIIVFIICTGITACLHLFSVLPCSLPRILRQGTFYLYRSSSAFIRSSILHTHSALMQVIVNLSLSYAAVLCHLLHG